MTWFLPPWYDADLNEKPFFSEPDCVPYCVIYDLGCPGWCTYHHRTTAVRFEPPADLMFVNGEAVDAMGDTVDVADGDVVAGFVAEELDFFGNPTNSGAVIGYWENETCGRPAYYNETASMRWRYTGSPNVNGNGDGFVVNWNRDYSSQIIGHIDLAGAVQGNLEVIIEDLQNTENEMRGFPTCENVTDFNHKISKSASGQFVQALTPAYCRYPYRTRQESPPGSGEYIASGRGVWDNTMPIVEVGDFCCIDSLLEVDPCLHELAWVTNADSTVGGTCPKNFSTGNLMPGVSDNISETTDGELRFEMNACNWDTEQNDTVGSWYNETNFIAFPNLLGQYFNIQRLTINMTGDTVLALYEIG